MKRLKRFIPLPPSNFNCGDMGGVLVNGICGYWQEWDVEDTARKGRDFYAQYFRLVTHKVKTSELGDGWQCPNPPAPPDPNNVMDPSAGPSAPPTLAEWAALGVQCPNCYTFCPCHAHIQGACGWKDTIIHHIAGGLFDPGGKPACTPGGLDYKMEICLPAKYRLDTTKILRQQDGNIWDRQRNHYQTAGSVFWAGEDTWSCWNVSLGVSNAQDALHLDEPRGSWSYKKDCLTCAYDMLISIQRCGDDDNVDPLPGGSNCAEIWNAVKKGKILFRRIGDETDPTTRVIFEGFTAGGTHGFTFLGRDGFCYKAHLITSPSNWQLNLCRWYNISGSGKQSVYVKDPLYVGSGDWAWIKRYASLKDCCGLDEQLGGKRDDGVSGEAGGCYTGKIKCNLKKGKCCHGDGTCTDNMDKDSCEKIKKGPEKKKSSWTGGSACGVKQDCGLGGAWAALLGILGLGGIPKGVKGCPQPDYNCCFTWHDANGVGKSECKKKPICDCQNGAGVVPAGITDPSDKEGKPMVNCNCPAPPDEKGACCDPKCRRIGRCGGGTNTERLGRLTIGGGCINDITLSDCYRQAGGKQNFTNDGWAFSAGKQCATNKADKNANPDKVYCNRTATSCRDVQSMLPNGVATKIMRYKFECRYANGGGTTVDKWDLLDDVDNGDVEDALGKYTKIDSGRGCCKLVSAWKDFTWAVLPTPVCLLDNRLKFDEDKFYSKCWSNAGNACTQKNGWGITNQPPHSCNALGRVKSADDLNEFP
jgi:hypothetical protein